MNGSFRSWDSGFNKLINKKKKADLLALLPGEAGEAPAGGEGGPGCSCWSRMPPRSRERAGTFLGKDKNVDCR